MRRGFTLVELIVVLAIVTILASLCIPAYFQESDLRLTLAMNQFIGELYQIQQLSECYGVASIQFWNDQNQGNYVISVNDSVFRTVHLPSAVFFGDDLGEVKYGNGWPVTGYTLKLTCRYARYDQLAIISLSTGRIRSTRQQPFPGGGIVHAFR